ncbi:MAG: valine--tRNA ligase, partial [Kiritimatiellae bacterium]|nr:valine--tRNA ligase [Kiritimatiellia bacterium]
KSREDLGRQAFVKRVWEWREQYGNTIINQLKRIGASCDWERERFTMDEGLSSAVAEVFVRLYQKGLIYRANYIINWCPRCHTALSDEESVHVDTNGKLYYIKYEVRSQETESKSQDPRAKKKKTKELKYIVVATTRPETLLGDVALAVNPKDKRYKGLEKKKIVLPVLGRELVVIKDDIIDPAFGTGVVKVTPAHDPNDFDMARRHNLTPINIMNGDGTMNEETGPYKGMDRFECRKKIMADLEAAGLVEKIEDHKHAVGHCYRCDTVVEPRLSPQWFVKMKPLAKPALEAVKSGKIQFIPGRWTKVYLEWMENIRDWCISRQIWWGHRIPVFYCDSCGNEWAQKGTPSACPKCGKTQIRQDEDVLDTWFSSWLWPFSTFGWPETNKDLKFYYPTHDLVTASEIIFFWVARMIMAGFEFMGDIPFSRVYIHGTVRDDIGRKMSKSLGNSIDPLTIIDEFSADALRFSLMMITATGQDIFLSNDKFEIGRNFGTKLWNAARFMKLHMDGGQGDKETQRQGEMEMRRDGKKNPEPGTPNPELRTRNPEPGCWGMDPCFDAKMLSPDDKHILARLSEAIAACKDNLEKYRFNDAAHVLYEFVWHQYCDWYVECSKDTLYGADAARKENVLKVMNYVFSNALRLLHPMMPFVTEELWHEMGYGAESDSIMTSKWPEAPDSKTIADWGIDTGIVEYVDDKHDLIRVGRTLKSDYEISPSKKVDYLVKPNSDKLAQMLKADLQSVKSLLRSENITVDVSLEPGKAMPSGISKLGTIYMPIKGLVDIDAEKKRLSAQLNKIDQDLSRISAKLQNMNFVSKAPAEVVELQKARKHELLETTEKLKRLFETLSMAE